MTHGSWSAYCKGCRCDPCRAAGRDYSRQAGQRWRDRNRQQYRDYIALYQRTHPEYRQRRRARKAGCETEPYRRADIFVRDEGRCHICTELVDPALWDLDHIVPIVHGGADAPWNVAVSHPRCNRQKGSRLDKPA